MHIVYVWTERWLYIRSKAGKDLHLLAHTITAKLLGTKVENGCWEGIPQQLEMKTALDSQKTRNGESTDLIRLWCDSKYILVFERENERMSLV